ncbi:MAG: type II toxin-antitoxin system VapC family toxin [Luteimonas sp.]
MLAVDTDVVVRFMTDDDPAQAAIARHLIATHPIHLQKTVALETEWVLRSLYRFQPADIAEALRGFAGLPNVTLEQPAVTAQALDWFAQGMDFADALHLASAEDCEAFATFDRKLVAAAKKAGAGKVKAL